MASAGFPVDQFQRTSAPGILCAFAALVGFEALFHIGGDAGVEGIVAAAENVDPVSHIADAMRRDAADIA